MATWTTIPDSSLEPGKPIRSIDTLALRDNPVAIAEGASGAPRVDLPAIVAALAAVPVGSIGSYAFLLPIYTASSPLNASITAGTVLAGSSLRYAGATGGAGGVYGSYYFDGTIQYAGAAVSGSWRLMGHQHDTLNENTSNAYGPSLWLRIS